MGVNISYMGTKRELAPAVSAVIHSAQPGIVLDAFSGMCSVAEEIAPRRQVWTNDTQVFAAEIARSLFTSRDDPPAATQVADSHYEQIRATQTGTLNNMSVFYFQRELYSASFDI